jgi:hypothetical protein
MKALDPERSIREADIHRSAARRAACCTRGEPYGIIETGFRGTIMKKAIAEFIGTFALVLIGCGAAVIAGMGSGATSIDILGIATAFGLAIVAMSYGRSQAATSVLQLALACSWPAG